MIGSGALVESNSIPAVDLVEFAGNNAVAAAALVSFSGREATAVAASAAAAASGTFLGAG